MRGPDLNRRPSGYEPDELPYPPGVLCVVPGEIWGGAAQRYFLALEEGINLLPGFAPELQGVYIQQDEDGWNRAYGYVMKN